MVENGLVALRRTIAPYVGQTVIFTAITAFCAYEGHKLKDWNVLWVPVVIWGCYAVLLGIGLKYIVLWNDTEVVMRASGLAERHIGFDEISAIRYELAGVSEFLSQSRPFRRVVIHGRKHDTKAFIDISLRHFRLNDIEELLAAIHERRPDLTFPLIPRVRSFNER